MKTEEDSEDIFSKKSLDKIFKVSPECSDRVSSNCITTAAQTKSMFCSKAKNKTLDKNTQVDQLPYALDAIRSLRAEEIDVQYLKSLLKYWFNKHYDRPKYPGRDRVRGCLRGTISFLDELLNKSSVL